MHESDILIHVDGERSASIVSSGWEDWFGVPNSMQRGPFSGLHTGCSHRWNRAEPHVPNPAGDASDSDSTLSVAYSHKQRVTLQKAYLRTVFFFLTSYRLSRRYALGLRGEVTFIVILRTDTYMGLSCGMAKR